MSLIKILRDLLSKCESDIHSDYDGTSDLLHLMRHPALIAARAALKETTPKWANIPAKYVWAARDADGEWYAYTKIPFIPTASQCWECTGERILIGWLNPNEGVFPLVTNSY